MTKFIERNPLWAFVILIAVAAALWLIFATWPQGLEDAFGRKKVFLSAVFNGITLGGLYFLVASGFTLIFGLMRNVNLAHGSLYLFGGYVGYAISIATGSWMLSFVVAFIVVALVGAAMQILVFRRIEGQDLRQTMVTIGLSIVFADLMLWAFGGDFYQIQTPGALVGPIALPFVTAVKSSGEAVYLQYPMVRLVIFAASVVIGCSRDCLYLVTLDRANGKPVVARRGALNGDDAAKTITLPERALRRGGYRVDVRLISRVDPGVVTRRRSPLLPVG